MAEPPTEPVGPEPVSAEPEAAPEPGPPTEPSMVQRQLDQEDIAGQTEPPQAAMQPPSRGEPEDSLGQKILARAMSGQQLPLTKVQPLSGHDIAEAKLPVMIQTKPITQTAVLPQTQATPDFGEETGSRQASEALTEARQPQTLFRKPITERVAPAPAEPQMPPSALPAPVADWLASEELVQRQPLVSPARPVEVSPGVGLLQRVIETSPPVESEPAETERSGPDLNDLARQIYPIIKQMLAIEQERSRFR